MVEHGPTWRIKGLANRRFATASNLPPGPGSVQPLDPYQASAPDSHIPSTKNFWICPGIDDNFTHFVSLRCTNVHGAATWRMDLL